MACAFPFTPPVVDGLDLQPLAVVFAGIFLLSKHRTLRCSLPDGIWVVVGLGVMLMNLVLSPTAMEARLSLSFLTFVVFYLYGQALAVDGLATLASVLSLALLSWLAISGLQITGFSFEILSPNRTTPGRGVTGLAPEPTFAALHLISLLPAVAVVALTELKGKKWARVMTVALVSAAMFIHLSSTAIAAILSGGLLAALYGSGNVLKLIIGIVVVLIFLMVLALGSPDAAWVVSIIQSVEAFIPGSGLRITHLLQGMVTATLFSDASFFDRMMSILKFVMDPYLMPFPRTHLGWISDVNQLIISLNIKDFNLMNEEYRNLSGFGQLNYYLGILMLIPVWRALRLFTTRHSFLRFSIGIFLVSSFMSIPIASPFFGITYGLMSRTGLRQPVIAPPAQVKAK